MNGSLLILFRKGAVIFFKNIIFLIIRNLFNKKKSLYWIFEIISFSLLFF